MSLGKRISLVALGLRTGYDEWFPPLNVGPCWLCLMRFASDKDLFSDSTMTFGEHLEELRACLFKAIIWLAVGICAGLYVGGDVANYIQTPLENALRTFYQNKSIEGVQHEAAKTSDKSMTETPAEATKLVEEGQLLPEEYYISPADLLLQLQQHYPEQFKKVAIPTAGPAATSRKDLIKLFLWRPMETDPRVKVKSLSAHEAFSIYMKASVLVGIVLASPMVFYHLWSFVAAGLYAHEKRYVYVFFPFSVILFLAGAALAFFVVFKPVLSFLFSFNSWMGIDPDPRISEWLSFVLILPLGFGIGFQLPLVMLFIERIGLLTREFYWRQWRLAVLIIAVIAVVLTPPDPYSMMLMFTPLTLLYFGGIGLCRFMPALRSPSPEEQENVE